jgi:hypothetical protein
MENAEEDVSKSKAGTTIGKLLGEIILKKSVESDSAKIISA